MSVFQLTPGPPPANGGLDGVDLEVRSGFIWRRVSLENGAQLWLKHASVGFIVDQERAWPTPGNLLIDGFVYSYHQPLPADSPWDAHTRPRWLALQPPGFHPQPYQQLAKVLRESGDERDTIQVQIAEEDARYRQSGLIGRFAGAFLKATIGTATGLCEQSGGPCWSSCSAGRWCGQPSELG